MTDKDYHPDGFVPMSMTVTPLEEFTFMPNGNGLFTLTVPAQGQVFQKPMSHDQAEELIAAHQGLTFTAIRAVERAHGII